MSISKHTLNQPFFSSLKTIAFVRILVYKIIENFVSNFVTVRSNILSQIAEVRKLQFQLVTL